MEIKNTKNTEKQFVKGIIYGSSGIGKTSLSKTCGAKTLILSAERGLLSLANSEVDYVDINTTEELSEAYAEIYNNDTYDTIIVDSITEIAEIILVKEKASTKDARQAYATMQEKVVKLFRAFRDLPNKHVFLLAQESKLIVDNKLLFVPGYPGAKLSDISTYKFDLIMRYLLVQDEDGINNRLLQTSSDLDSVAKDRSGRLDFFENPNIGDIIAKINM